MNEENKAPEEEVKTEEVVEEEKGDENAEEVVEEEEKEKLNSESLVKETLNEAAELAATLPAHAGKSAAEHGQEIARKIRDLIK
jgi:hypothetical protein